MCMAFWSCVIRCVLLLEWAILLMLEWQDHITRTFLSVDIYRSIIFHKWTRKMTNSSYSPHPIVSISATVTRTFLSVDIYMMKCNSAILTGYLFRQWPVCVRVPNWKNVLCLCVWRFANWKNVMCHWKKVLRVSAAIRCVSHVCNSYDKVTLNLTTKSILPL